MERLQKFMALCGVASRRKCEELIVTGKVKVNDEVVTELGTKIDTVKDIVKVEGKLIKPRELLVYLMVNKPVGYVTTAKDQFNRPTVLDLVNKDIKERVYPVGRLDYDSSGLLLLTNDGDLTYRITHPKHNVQKEYICLLDKIPSQEDIEKFKNGVDIGDYVTAPAYAKLVGKKQHRGLMLVKISEGKNRQIRRMWQALGFTVLSLERIAIGKIKLGNLKLASFRPLSVEEVEYLKSL